MLSGVACIEEALDLRKAGIKATYSFIRGNLQC